MTSTVASAVYLFVGVVVMVVVRPKYRDVLIRSHPPAETFDHLVFGIVSVLTVLAWPLVLLGCAFVVLGKLLAR